jgi:hypothetical protein
MAVLHNGDVGGTSIKSVEKIAVKKIKFCITNSQQALNVVAVAYLSDIKS